MDKDLYEILGASRTSTPSELKKKYHKLAKQYHPDRNPGDKEAEQRFKEANLAYEVLKDPKKKAQYDQMRAHGQNPFAREPRQGGFRPDMGGGADFGLGDLFDQIFGGGGNPFGGGVGGGSYSGHTFSRRGASREVSVQVEFLEAVKGGEKPLAFSDGKRITVTIPAGVKEGSKIKLRGQGEPGVGGAPNGDLYLIVSVKPHASFSREGNNIIYKLPISFPEAVLGAEISVPTVDGNVTMKIPKGLSSGKRLKLKGKGVGKPGDPNRGDQLVEVSIKLPAELPESYIKAAESLKSESFSPR